MFSRWPTTRFVQVSAGSRLSPRANRVDPGKILFSRRSGSMRARNDILISKSEPLDLEFNLLPLLSQPFEHEAVTIRKMTSQLVVTKNLSKNIFHRRLRMLATRGDYRNNLIEGSGSLDCLYRFPRPATFMHSTEPSFSRTSDRCNAARFAAVAEGSTLLSRADRAYPGKIRFACRPGIPGAGNDLLISDAARPGRTLWLHTEPRRPRVADPGLKALPV